MLEIALKNITHWIDMSKVEHVSRGVYQSVDCLTIQFVSGRTISISTVDLKANTMGLDGIFLQLKKVWYE